jgi:hypothetical protein
METRVRTRTTPGFVWNYSWLRLRAAPDSYGDPFGPFIEAYSDRSEYFEEMTPNSAKYANRSPVTTWNSFEHYRIERLPRTSQFIVFLDAYYDHSNWWRSQVNEELVGLQGYTDNSCLFSSPTSVFGEPGFPISGLPVFYQKRPSDNGFVPEPEHLADLESRAMSVMMPGIKAGLSSINTLIELKDFKSLPKTLSNVRNWFDNLSKIPYVNLATTVRQAKLTIRQLYHGTASGYLEAKFNVLSFLGDLVGLQKALISHQHKLSELIARQGQLQKRHFTVDLNEFPNRPTDISPIILFFAPCGQQSNVASRCQSRRNVAQRLTTFHVEIEYNYLLPEISAELAQLGGLLDSLGVYLNPRIIWNAIPFSFLIDWVVNIGSFLEKFSHRNLEPKVNILHYCWSVKRDRTVFVDKTITSSNNTQPEFGDVQVVPCRTVRETAYRRQSGYPTPSLLQTSGLSATEVSLGAALLITRKWKPKRSHVNV